MKSRPAQIRAMRMAVRPRAIGLAVRPNQLVAFSLAPSSAAFHTSSTRANDNRPAGVQSPFRVFVQTLKEEIQKNRELQQDVQRLQGDVDKLADSAAMQRAKELYERTRLTNALKNNPRLREAADNMKAAGGKVSEGVAEAMKAVEESEFMRNLAKASTALSSAASAATAPVRETAAYKALAESVVDAFEEGNRYGGYEGKEDRRRRREERKKRSGWEKGKKRRVEVNPDAGEALVLSANQPSSSSSSSWTSRLTSTESYQRFSESYHESENPVVSTVRSITSTVGSWFEENETARVIRMFKQMDPTFTMTGFEKELRDYIVPEVVDAYLGADREALKMWCGEATYNVLWATMQQYAKQGLVSDSRVIDISQVEISTGKILENDIPVFLVTFATQEILAFRSIKTGEVVVGSLGSVESCNYAAVLTITPEELDNEDMAGWKVMEMARRGSSGKL